MCSCRLGEKRGREGERERIGADLQLSFDISRCRRDTAAPDKRRESRGHNLVSFLTRSQGARALYSQSLPTRLVTDKHRHDSNETSGSVLRRSFEYTRAFSLSRSLALSLAPFKANRYSCNALIPSMRGNAIPRNEKCLSKVATLERGRDIRWIRAPCSRFLFPHFHFMSLFENLCIFPGFFSRRNFTFRIAIMILLQSNH